MCFIKYQIEVKIEVNSFEINMYAKLKVIPFLTLILNF